MAKFNTEQTVKEIYLAVEAFGEVWYEDDYNVTKKLVVYPETKIPLYLYINAIHRCFLNRKHVNMVYINSHKIEIEITDGFCLQVNVYKDLEYDDAGVFIDCIRVE